MNQEFQTVYDMSTGKTYLINEDMSVIIDISAE